MPTLIENLNLIESCKLDIKSAIENKGVDMTGVSFSEYASKIGEIQTGGTFVTETLSVSQNGTYYPGQGVDGFSQVDVNVPQDVTGFTMRQVLEASGYESEINDYSTSFVSIGAMLYTSIKTLNLPNCKFVGAYAFCSCFSLETVILPECSSVDGFAFYNCNKLTQISLPVCKTIGRKYVAMGSSPFSGCSLLSEIYFPKVEEVAGMAFAACKNLTTVNLPKCSLMEGSIFSGCSLLTTVSLPYCLSMANSVFTGCSALQELSLPVVSSIGNYCFRSCTNLQKLTLCNETYLIPTYQNQFFSNTTFWTNGSIYVASDMYSRWIVATGWSSRAARFVSLNQSGPVLSYDTGTVYGITKYMDSTFLTFLGISKNDIVKLSTNVMNVPNLFSDCIYLTEINLPLCFSISNNAFRGCTSLTQVSLPACENIAFDAFRGCTSLTQVSLPVCSYINNSAFDGCTSLSQVSLPACSYISNNAFNSCTSLTQVSLPACSYIGNNAFRGCTSLTQVSLPACEIIGMNTFTDCTSLSQVSLPVCTQIQYAGFAGCNLSSVDLPVCSLIGEFGFNNCSNLSVLVLRSSSVCNLVGGNAFQGTSFWRFQGSIYVPSSLVDTYKTATNWAAYSSIIFPIPE